MPPDDNHLVTEQLYKQNAELAVKNKTLSLLRELYAISILALEPKALAEKVTATIRQTLEFEMVGLLTYNHETDSLSFLASSGSERFDQACAAAGGNFCLSGISQASTHPFFASILAPTMLSGQADKMEKRSENLAEVFHTTAELQTKSHIKTSLFYPLVIEGKVLGILTLNLNRAYTELNQSDQDAITSLVNVIAVALDRASLYQQIKEANEKLKELDVAKTEFVSMASHQLRAPLTSIKGYSSMLLEGSFGPIEAKARNAVDIVFQSSQKLNSVIEDFLNVTRIELGKMKYEMTNFDLKQLVESTIKEVTPTVERKGLSLSFVADAGQDYKITADYGKLAQVINNLIDNAMKYTPQGAINLKLSKSAGKTRLAVSDSGVGIAPEMMAKLFQKFTRATDASKANAGGTGLGLYVAKQIIEGHHGKLWAESEGVGKGSTFVVEV